MPIRRASSSPWRVVYTALNLVVSFFAGICGQLCFLFRHHCFPDDLVHSLSSKLGIDKIYGGAAASYALSVRDV